MHILSPITRSLSFFLANVANTYYMLNKVNQVLRAHVKKEEKKIKITKNGNLVL